MSNVSVATLLSALKNSWTSETSSHPNEWITSNPARGQCVPSSLVIQDYLGGELGRYEVVGTNIYENHYFNVLDNGCVIDSTISQYENKKVTFTSLPVNLKGYDSVREKRLANKHARERYLLLKSRVEKYLKKVGEV